MVKTGGDEKGRILCRKAKNRKWPAPGQVSPNDKWLGDRAPSRKLARMVGNGRKKIAGKKKEESPFESESEGRWR